MQFQGKEDVDKSLWLAQESVTWAHGSEQPMVASWVVTPASDDMGSSILSRPTMTTTEELFAHLEERRKRPINRYWRQPMYQVKRKLLRVRTWPRRAYQRHTKGYDYEALWNMDEYLADLLARMFNDLAETNHGYPATMTYAEWTSTLNEIAAGFEAYVDWEDKWRSTEEVSDNEAFHRYNEKFDEAFKRVQFSLTLMREHWPSFWD